MTGNRRDLSYLLKVLKQLEEAARYKAELAKGPIETLPENCKMPPEIIKSDFVRVLQAMPNSEHVAYAAQLSQGELADYLGAGNDGVYRVLVNTGSTPEEARRTAAIIHGTGRFVVGYLYAKLEESKKPVVESTHEQTEPTNEQDGEPETDHCPCPDCAKIRQQLAKTQKRVDSTADQDFRDANLGVGQAYSGSGLKPLDSDSPVLSTCGDTEKPKTEKPFARAFAEAGNKSRQIVLQEIREKWQRITLGFNRAVAGSETHPMSDEQNVIVRGCLSAAPNDIIKVSMVDWLGNWVPSSILVEWADEINDYHTILTEAVANGGWSSKGTTEKINLPDDGRLLCGYCESQERFVIFNESEICSCDPSFYQKYKSYLDSRPEFISVLRRAMRRTTLGMFN